MALNSGLVDRTVIHRIGIEVFSKFAYAKDADEFVRLVCRGYAGWRRDEWAYSPLFIWLKFTAK